MDALSLWCFAPQPKNMNELRRTHICFRDSYNGKQLHVYHWGMPTNIPAPTSLGPGAIINCHIIYEHILTCCLFHKDVPAACTNHDIMNGTHLPRIMNKSYKCAPETNSERVCLQDPNFATYTTRTAAHHPNQDGENGQISLGLLVEATTWTGAEVRTEGPAQSAWTKQEPARAHHTSRSSEEPSTPPLLQPVINEPKTGAGARGD